MGGGTAGASAMTGGTPTATPKRDRSSTGGAGKSSSRKAEKKAADKAAKGLERCLAKLTENQRVRVWDSESRTLRAARVFERGPSSAFVHGCTDPGRQATVRVVLDGGRGAEEATIDAPLGMVSIGVPGVGHGKEKVKLAVGEAVEVSAHGAPGDAVGIVVEGEDKAGYGVRHPWGGPDLDAKKVVRIRGNKLRRLRLGPVLDGVTSWQYAYPPGRDMQVKKGEPLSPFSLRLWSQGEHDNWITSLGGAGPESSGPSSRDGDSSSNSSSDESSSSSDDDDGINGVAEESDPSKAAKMYKGKAAAKMRDEGRAILDEPSAIPGGKESAKKSSQTNKLVTPSGRAPRKPPSAASNYVHSEMLALRHSEPDMPQQDMVRLLTKRFESLPDEERRPWDERAQASMKNYEIRMELHRQQKETTRGGYPSGSAFKAFKGGAGSADEMGDSGDSEGTTPKVLKKKSKKAKLLAREVFSIKRPVSGFMEFSRAIRAEHSKDPGAQKMSFAEISKHVAQLWKDLPESERQPYNDIAQRNKAEYMKKVAEQKAAMRNMAVAIDATGPTAFKASVAPTGKRGGKRKAEELAALQEMHTAPARSPYLSEPVDMKFIKAGLVKAGLGDDAYLLVVDAKRDGPGSKGQRAVDSGLEEFVFGPPRENPPTASDWKAFLVHVAGYDRAASIVHAASAKKRRKAAE